MSEHRVPEDDRLDEPDDPLQQRAEDEEDDEVESEIHGADDEPPRTTGDYSRINP